MTAAQNILDMIETVNPNNTNALDEIDARVWCWLNNWTFSFIGSRKEPYGFIAKQDHDGPVCEDVPKAQYTRSRDALKSIRPEGWHYECNKICNGTYWAAMHEETSEGVSGDEEGESFQAWYLKSEELAELHAIIQAIEYERTIKHPDRD